MWVSRGDFVNEGCVNGCYKFVVNTRDFPAATTRIDCWNDSGGAHRFGTRYSFNLPANGSVQLLCWSGFDGYNVWVDIITASGGVDTETASAGPRN